MVSMTMGQGCDYGTVLWLLTLAAASVGGQCVAPLRTRAVEAPGAVVAAVGADVSPGGKRALINIWNTVV